MSKISSFKDKENKHDVSRGKDSMKKNCESLRQHVISRQTNKQKELLANKQMELYKNAKIYYICEEHFEDNYIEDAKCCKNRDHCHYTGEYRGATHSICHLKCSRPKEIPTVFHNGSNYNYHFIIKGLAEEFKGKFICLEENIEKTRIFSIRIE